jgi:hypothetical protein
MVARSVVLCLCVLAASVSSGSASDVIEAVSGNGRELATVEDVATDAFDRSIATGRTFEPRILREMSDRMRNRLVSSFQLAIDRVREVPECGNLFTELGADGVDTIADIRFTPIGIYGARANVCKGKIAYTYVGGGPIWLCRDFSRLTDKKAAMIIIHEALHHAGLTERPEDPDAMPSAGINRMVSQKCGL